MFNIKIYRTMKKTYINPEMTVIEMKAQQLLAASETKGFVSGTVDAGSSRSRDFDIEFDEDEDY